MNDFFDPQDRSNKPVLATTRDAMSTIPAQLAEKLRLHRKVNSGTPVQPKSTVPWYRRFDKR